MKKIDTKTRKKYRIRNKLKKISSLDRFRLTVSRSLRNISAQIIDDKVNKTLVSASSLKERNKDITTSAKPGGITFYYGEDQPFVITAREFLPKENTLMIFPSTFKHEVIGFKSNVCRISVAGNIKVHHG